MKFLIALLTAATGILHLLIGFDIVAGFGSTNWLLVLNGVGYLVLLVLFWTGTGGRNLIRWVLLAYTLITFAGYFIINAGDNFGLNNTMGLVIKAIELLLIIALLLYRERQPVARQAPAATASTRGPGAASESVAMSTMATTSAAGVTAAAGAAAAGAATAAAMTEEKAADTLDVVDETIVETDVYAGDAVDRMGDNVELVEDTAADMVSDAGYETSGEVVAGAAVVGAADEVEEIMDREAAEIDGADLAAEPTAEELRAELEEYLRSFGPSSEFRKEIEYVEGIGSAYGQKLRAVGVVTILDLMVNGATRRGRKQLSDRSGIAQSMILTWVNHVDLFRIKGVAQEYADLLEQSGVDTVVELAQRNPVNLHKRMLEINEQKSLVRRAPHASEVQSWVEQAKNLRRLIHY